MNGKTIGQRLIQSILVLIGISFITFSLIMLSPGDPVRQMITGNQDIMVSSVEIETLRHDLGLDKPFILQYFDWLGRVVQGNLGHSYMVKQPVVDALLRYLPNTILLALSSTFFMLVISIPVGIYSAVHQNKLGDYLVRMVSFIGISVPNFWMGLLLLWFFGLQLRLLPIVSSAGDWRSIVLPTLILGIVMASKYTRQVRAMVLGELHQDYVIGAKTRGMSQTHILWKEVLPNVLLPLITLLGLSFGSLLGGTAVVEMVFGWPGLGNLAVQAITYRDFPLVQGIVLWISMMYMVINLVVDISYAYLDPHVRKGGA